jgi:hypothetical protein
MPIQNITIFNYFDSLATTCSPGGKPQVPSALEGLTSVFGMGTGGSPPLWSPDCYGVPWRIRTPDLLIRSQTLCPAELRAHILHTLKMRMEEALPHMRSRSRESPRPIRIRQLNTLLCLHPGPIYLVICKGSYFHEGMGNLILRGASRLDAFSAYPGRTWLPSGAPGGTTGTPEVRPSRSSRTKDSSSQISCARDR